MFMYMHIDVYLHVYVNAGKSLFDLADPWAYYIINAIKAKELFSKDKDYIINADGQVSIIDTFSGRVLEGRRFTDGLQQSIEVCSGALCMYEHLNWTQSSMCPNFIC
jgi:preprotein translocase subunit SecA